MPIHDTWPTGFQTKLDFTLWRVARTLWLAWTDAEGSVQLAHGIPPPSGQIVWTAEGAFAAGVTTGPSMITDLEGALHEGIVIAYGNADGHVEVVHINPDDRVVPPKILDDTTSQRPSLAWWSARLWIAWTGTDGHLNTMRSIDAFEFDDKKHYDETSSASPGLGNTAVNLTLGWTGTDARRSVFTADVDAFGDLNTKELGDFDGSAMGVTVSGSTDTMATWASAEKEYANQICLATDPVRYDAEFTRDPLTSNVTPYFAGGYVAYTDANDEIWVGRY